MPGRTFGKRGLLLSKSILSLCSRTAKPLSAQQLKYRVRRTTESAAGAEEPAATRGVRLPGCCGDCALVLEHLVGFKGDKISHEHIYWDQAGVLVQIGLLSPAGLPVTGGESARKVLNPKLPPRAL